MHMKQLVSLPSRQRGMSFISLCLLAMILVFVGYVGFKSVPIMSEYMSLKKALKQAAQESTVIQIRNTFDRVSSVEYLDQYENPVRGKDLQISKQNDQIIVRVDYIREIPLFGPAYLTYKLQASSQ